MLCDENEIEEDGDIRQEKLDWVTRHSAPVILETGVQNKLNQRQNTASQVEENLDNAPSYSRLAFVIDPRLGYVFEHGDG